MLLSINTSTVQFSMALMGEDGAVVAEHLVAPGSRNFKNFMPLLHDTLTATATDFMQIKALIVAKGPGSFTGLRVGLAAAKGICQGLKIPLIGVSGLEAMASQLPYANRPICAMIDSRKGEVFAAIFDGYPQQTMVRIREETCLSFGALPSFVGGETIYVGNNFGSQAPEIVNIFGREALLAPASLWNLKASAVASVGLSRYHASDFDDLQNLIPLYLRPPDIRPNPFPAIRKAHELRDGTRHDMIVDK